MWLRAKVRSRPSGVTCRREKRAPALLISTSTRFSLAAIAAPARRVSAMLERSARCSAWPSPGAFASILPIVACPRASSRATRTTRAPIPASASAAASDARGRAGGDDGLALHPDDSLVSPSRRHFSLACATKRSAPIECLRRRRGPVSAAISLRYRGRRRTDQMAKDQQGLELAGSAQSAAAFDRAIADYYGLTGDPVGVLKTAVQRDPGFALGSVAIAALYMIGGFRGDHPEVVSALRAAEAALGCASERERRHFA